jgi:hypothetical protein
MWGLVQTYMQHLINFILALFITGLDIAGDGLRRGEIYGWPTGRKEVLQLAIIHDFDGSVALCHPLHDMGATHSQLM